MTNIVYIDRESGQTFTEKVYKERALRLLYGESWLSRLISPWLLPLLSASAETSI
jgi:phosphatidylserine decarboxylase